jgi:putative oxidoreductase
MRLVAGITSVTRAIAGLTGELTMGPAPLLVLQIGLGLLFIAGLWTPVAGTLLAVLQIGYLLLRIGDPWIHLLLATFGIALALLGPGAWSADARLFGWKRIHIRDRSSRIQPPPKG